MDTNSEATISKYKELINVVKVCFKALSLSYNATPSLTTIYLGSNILGGIVPIFSLWMGKVILDQLVLLIQKDPSTTINDLLTSLIILFGIEVFTRALLTINYIVFQRLHDELQKYGQTALLKKSLILDLKKFEDSNFYNAYERVTSRIDTALPILVIDIADLLSKIVLFVSVSIVLVQINWMLLPLIIILNIPVLLWGMGYSLSVHNLSSYHIVEGRKAYYLATLATNKHSVKEVRLFNLGNYFLDKYNNFFEKIINENWKLSRQKIGGAFVVNFVSDVVQFGYYVWVVIKAIDGTFTVGDVGLYTSAFSRANGALSGTLKSINSIYKRYLVVNEFAEFLELEPTILDPKDPIPLDRIKSIEFINVSFSYRDDLPAVLNDVSFKIEENQNIALIGINGAGKTTIVKLMMRFFDVTSGEILINGHNIKNYKLRDLWDAYGTIFQDFVKYEMTARENIGFGQIEKIDNEELIKEAAEKSGASDFINKLPKTYDTQLGTQFDDGADLSIGQWQKIALSRAFLRNSSVLILDEPTASLDAKAEYEIFEKFVDLVKDQITFLISHRFSTVRLADKIMVLENGRIKEQGTHKELLAQKGTYSEMFNMQAEGYK